MIYFVYLCEEGHDSSLIVLGCEAHIKNQALGRCLDLDIRRATDLVTLPTAKVVGGTDIGRAEMTRVC